MVAVVKNVVPGAVPAFVEVLPESLGRDVIEIRSVSNPKTVYRVDVVNKRCSCPAWIYQRGPVRKPCKHLKSMGLI
jgi:SWIM zinc finger